MQKQNKNSEIVIYKVLLVAQDFSQKSWYWFVKRHIH